MIEEPKSLQAKVFELIDESGNPHKLADAITDALKGSHRTLQQSFWSAIKLAIHQYAQQEYATDGRNQAAREWTKEVAALENGDLRFPYI